MHSLALILFLAVADSPKSTALQPAPVPVASLSGLPRLPWGGKMRLMLIKGPKDTAKKMTCNAECADWCWLADSNCMLAGGSGEECLIVYQNCICESHCCTPEDEPAYCQ